MLFSFFSQHTIPPSSPSIEIHKPEKPTLTIPLKNTLTVDHHSHRRHSVDTSQHSPTHETGPIVVKSQSSIMPLQANESHNVSEQFLTPTMQRKKSVSSKERLFSVESLQRTSSTRSMERRLKVKTPSTDSKTSEREILKATENEGELSSKLGERKLTSLSVTTPDNVNNRNCYVVNISFDFNFRLICMKIPTVYHIHHSVVGCMNIEIVYCQMIQV